jgi:hypothetical protein
MVAAVSSSVAARASIDITYTATPTLISSDPAVIASQNSISYQGNTITFASQHSEVLSFQNVGDTLTSRTYDLFTWTSTPGGSGMAGYNSSLLLNNLISFSVNGQPVSSTASSSQWLGLNITPSGGNGFDILQYSANPITVLLEGTPYELLISLYGVSVNEGDVDSYKVLADFTLLEAVPEPTTFIAGGLLLFPFGLSAFRLLRQKQSA